MLDAAAKETKLFAELDEQAEIVVRQGLKDSLIGGDIVLTTYGAWVSKAAKSFFR